MRIYEFKNDLIRLKVELCNPVEIPAYVAKWIKDHKKKGLNFYVSVSRMTTGDVDEWYLDNEDSYVKAWYFGYTVKQEQLYYVKLTEKEYLCYDIDEDEYFSDSVDETDGYKMKFTESEIKAIDERYMAFAVKVEEG